MASVRARTRFSVRVLALMATRVRSASKRKKTGAKMRSDVERRLRQATRAVLF